MNKVAKNRLRKSLFLPNLFVYYFITECIWFFGGFGIEEYLNNPQYLKKS